ncbi:MAG: T9SS type A sorting domain-containing protein [Chitinophagaceae bacterium]|nr:T9SS type A sorting domain-containing protein [Chitinophagaceae bacterium]
MKRYILLFASVLAFSFVQGQYNIVWNFGYGTPTQGASTTVEPNTSTSTLERQQSAGSSDIITLNEESSGYADASGTYNIQLNSRSGATINGTTSFVTFTLTPNINYSITIKNIDFGSWSDGEGPTIYSIRTDLDNYATDVATGALNNNSTWAFYTNTELSITNNGPINIRIYGYGATNGGTFDTDGNWHLDDISLIVVSTSLLPIKFADVTAKATAGGNTVQWSNLTESDMSHYSVEYSTNGKYFKEIARIKPTKNDHGAASYSYTHTTPETDNSFYRIKGVELSGTILYSNIVTTTSTGNSGRIQLYPNPAVNGSSSLQIASLPKGVYELDIVNLSGQTVYKQSISHGGGGIYIPLRLPYVAGMYAVKLNGKNTQIIKTVLVDRR